MLQSSILNILFFYSFLAFAESQSCPAPQKGVYMSFDAISKRDTMTNLFKEVTATLDKYSDSFTNSSTGTTYSITAFRPMLFYNEHPQK